MKKKDFEMAVLYAESERENADLHCSFSALKRLCWKRQAEKLAMNQRYSGVNSFDDASIDVSDVLAILGVSDNPDLVGMMAKYKEREVEDDE